MKQQFTRQEVIQLVEELLYRPDHLIDAVTNVNTNWCAETLVDFAVKCVNESISYCDDPVGHSQYY